MSDFHAEWHMLVILENKFCVCVCEMHALLLLPFSSNILIPERGCNRTVGKAVILRGHIISILNQTLPGTLIL
jgi:hypothetical protein